MTVSGSRRRAAWSSCPNCFRDLAAKPFRSKPPYTYCPFCGVALTHVWWQRIVCTVLVCVIASVVPAALGIRGLALLFAALVCFFPALVVAMILVFKTMPPKYARKSGAVMTLFNK